jgi:hypothetical protein
VLASTSLREEGVERVVATADGLVGRHLAIGLDAVLKAQKLPSGVTSLDTSLAKVNSDALSHCELKGFTGFSTLQIWVSKDREFRNRL